MKHIRLSSFVIVIMFVMISLVGFVPVASAHEVSRIHITDDSLNDSCRAGTTFLGIQMTSRTTGGVIPVPITSISVDPCSLSYLMSKGDPAGVMVQADSSVPAFFVPIFKQAVIAHSRDLWNKDLTCPKPEEGVFFTMITPTIWTAFTPSIYYDMFEELHPMVACA